MVAGETRNLIFLHDLVKSFGCRVKVRPTGLWPGRRLLG